MDEVRSGSLHSFSLIDFLIKAPRRRRGHSRRGRYVALASCPLNTEHALISLPGQDATEAFEDVGHSDEARALLPDMLVGDYEQGGVRFSPYPTRPPPLLTTSWRRAPN